MTAHPISNPHPERGPLWVQHDRYARPTFPHALMRDDVLLDDFDDDNAAVYAAQLGQDLPEGFTLAPVATGDVVRAMSDDEWEGWEWTRIGAPWRTDRTLVLPLEIVHVRRIAKPAKVRVKVGDAYGRTIDGTLVTGSGRNTTYPNGWYSLAGCRMTNADADGMVEVDPLDGDR